MIKSFFINLLRGIVCYLIVGAIVAVLSLLIKLVIIVINAACAFLSGGVNMISMSGVGFYMYLVISAVVGGFVTLILLGMTYSKDIFHDENFIDDKHAVPVYLALFLHFILTAGTAAFLTYYFYDYLSASAMGESIPAYVVMLGSFGGFHIIYLIVMLVHYGEQTCTACGHIFCIDRTLASTTSYKSAQYKTDTERTQVGTLQVGDYAWNVYSDQKKGRLREKVITEKRYNCNCLHCGGRFQATDSETSYGKWE